MKTQIEIRGRRYTVRSDEEDVDLAAVAAYVDRQISEIADKSPALDDYTAAMLAALNIASEYQRFRQSVDSELEGLDKELAVTQAMLGAAGATPADSV